MTLLFLLVGVPLMVLGLVLGSAVLLLTGIAWRWGGWK